VPTAEHAHAPAETDGPWPMALALGLATLITGLVVHWSITIVGVLVMGYAVQGYLRQMPGLHQLEGYMLRTPRGSHALGGTSVRKMGMWMFLFSEILFFTGLIGGSLALRARAGSWPAPGEVLNVPLTAANTFILICSSMTMVEALRGAQAGDMRHMRLFLLLTMALGIVFVSIQAREYTLLFFNEGLRPGSGLYGSTFYIQTGFHGGHVTAGIVALAYVNYRASKGAYTKEDHEGIELMGLYWHFVDVVWIFLFTIVYLL
jgi:cytochrome c oxidase subunit I+III